LPSGGWRMVSGFLQPWRPQPCKVGIPRMSVRGSFTTELSRQVIKRKVCSPRRDRLGLSSDATRKAHQCRRLQAQGRQGGAADFPDRPLHGRLGAAAQGRAMARGIPRRVAVISRPARRPGRCARAGARVAPRGLEATAGLAEGRRARGLNCHCGKAASGTGFLSQ
jgi:hypothetical protein